MHRRALLAGGFLLAAGGWAGSGRAEPEPADLAALEPLYAVSAAPSGLTIRVASNGCTAKADFAFYVQRKPGGVSVAFGRKRVDICKPAKVWRGWVDLAFSDAELGLGAGEAVSVLNPIVAAPAMRASTRAQAGAARHDVGIWASKPVRHAE